MKNQHWHQFYTEKRIIHQWMQVHLLDGLEVERVLEIGPYLGLVTAMLQNAGYDVTTLDMVEGGGMVGDVGESDVGEIAKRNFDTILCC